MKVGNDFPKIQMTKSNFHDFNLNLNLNLNLFLLLYTLHFTIHALRFFNIELRTLNIE